ncbi:hypothetical protein GXW82_22995 [Streptacidiphilus sp. 4-A2]|nr:hypothetical protein [Streptacidiphilus sp. 4-A2]
MASHRRPKSPSRTRVTVLTAAAATAVAITANAQSAQAAPQPTTASLEAQVQALNTASDAAVQKFDAAQEQQQQFQKQVTTLENEIARQQAAINAQEATLGASAAAQYRMGTIDPSVQLMLSSNPTDYLQQASATAQLDKSQAEMLTSLQGEQTVLDHEKAQAESELKALDANTRQLSAAKAQMQQKLAAAQAKLNSFTAAQRAAINAALNSGVKGNGGGGDNGGGNGGGGNGDGDGNGYNPGGVQPGPGTDGDSIEMAAFAAARTRIGDPYHWTSIGPDEFDCSGLMMWAYAQAGMNIGRTTYDQINVGTPVDSVADLRIGDLIFFNDNTHVGMYAGGGVVLHAPHTGANVRFESLSTIGTIYAMRHI